MATPVPQKDDVEHWTVEQVAAWLQQVELSECCDTFLRKGIDGHNFLQLSEEDLFLWGRDVSIRNRKQILKLVSQIKNLQQHSSATRPSLEVYPSYNSQSCTAYSDSQMHTGYCSDDSHYEDSDFSDDDVEDDHLTESQPPQTQWLQMQPPQGQPPQVQRPQKQPPQTQPSQAQRPQMQPPQTQTPQAQRAPMQPPQELALQDKNGQDWRNPIRAPQPSPRNQQRQDDSPDDIYLTPIEPTSKPDLTRNPSSKMPPSSKNVLWNPGRRNNLNDSQSSKPPCGWGPASPQHQQTSQSKKPPDASSSPLLPPKPRASNRPPFQGNTNSQIGPGGSGRGRSSFLHGSLQENKSGTLSKPPLTKELAQLPLSAQEDDEHVYEIMNESHEASEIPDSNVLDWKSYGRPSGHLSWNQNQDFDDQGLSSHLASTLAFKKLPAKLPDLCKKLSDEGSDTGRVPSPRSGSPNQTIRKGSHKSVPMAYRQESPQESQAPQEFAPSLPAENQPHVTLDDGETILLTPLYQKIMEKPYFHMISRPKAKALITNGDDGMYLVRPSTRTGNPLTLTLKEDSRPYNINIRQRPDNLFALGAAKQQEQTFTSVDELINTFKREPIKLKNGKTSFLRHTPPKQGSIYVKHHPVGLGKKY